MRLDKYLKVTRLIKRREAAKEMIERGLVSVNSKPAKPATEIKEGDDILITSLTGRKVEVTVKSVQEYATVQSAPTLYEVKEKTDE